MADYQAMYYKMFNTVTDAERQLQQVAAMLQTAQQECEEIFLSAKDTPIFLSQQEEKRE